MIGSSERVIGIVGMRSVDLRPVLMHNRTAWNVLIQAIFATHATSAPKPRRFSTNADRMCNVSSRRSPSEVRKRCCAALNL